MLVLKTLYFLQKVILESTNRITNIEIFSKLKDSIRKSQSQSLGDYNCYSNKNKFPPQNLALSLCS